jgi:2TM domain
VTTVPSGGTPDNGTGRSARARDAFRRHAVLFVIGSIALNVANYYVGTGWWAFWPLAAWGALFMIHYLRYKAATVDERWVDARVADLRIKSYDRDHIENITAHGPGAASREDDS